MMTVRLETIAVLLMIGGALAATPALAADAVEGYRGPAVKPASRDLLFTPPGRITPQPTPQVDEENRGLFEPVMAIDDLTTVSFRFDAGAVTETTASDTLRAIFDAAHGPLSK